VLTVPQIFKPTSMLDCHLELLRSAPNPIVGRKRVRFHVGTAELMGYAVLLGQDRLEPGQSGFVQIRIEEPSFALPGDRFIVRQYSPMVTIGGGQILDTYPARHRRSDKGIVEKLRVLRDGSVEERLMFLIEDAGLASVDLPRLVARLGVPAAAVRGNIAKLAKASLVRTILEHPRTFVAEAAFKSAVNGTVTEVKRFHQQNPLVQGISREELRNRVLAEAPNSVFQSVLDQLVAGKQLVVTQDTIQEFGRKVTLKGGEEQIRNQLIERFQTLGLRVPTPDELIDALKADRITARKIVQLLIKENVLVKVADDFVLHRETIDKLIAAVKDLKSKNPKLGVGEFKDLTGVTRKYAIPLLEYLDRQRITRRVGEDRLIL